MDDGCGKSIFPRIACATGRNTTGCKGTSSAACEPIPALPVLGSHNCPMCRPGDATVRRETSIRRSVAQIHAFPGRRELAAHAETTLFLAGPLGDETESGIGDRC